MTLPNQSDCERCGGAIAEGIQARLCAGCSSKLQGHHRGIRDKVHALKVWADVDGLGSAIFVTWDEEEEPSYRVQVEVSGSFDVDLLRSLVTAADKHGVELRMYTNVAVFT